MKHTFKTILCLLIVAVTASCSSYKVSRIGDIKDIDSNIKDNVRIDVSKITITEDIVIEKVTIIRE